MILQGTLCVKKKEFFVSMTVIDWAISRAMICEVVGISDAFIFLVFRRSLNHLSAIYVSINSSISLFYLNLHVYTGSVYEW